MLLREAIVLKMGEVGWSQADLGRATGIPRQNLSPILRGERPLRIQHLLVIALALGLDLDYNACSLPDDVSRAKSE